LDVTYNAKWVGVLLRAPELTFSFRASAPSSYLATSVERGVWDPLHPSGAAYDKPENC